MRTKLRHVAIVVILTILIATVGTLALLLVGAAIPPVGAVAAIVTGHPAGGLLGYGFAALIAVLIARHQSLKARLSS